MTSLVEYLVSNLFADTELGLGSHHTLLLLKKFNTFLPASAYFLTKASEVVDSLAEGTRFSLCLYTKVTIPGTAVLVHLLLFQNPLDLVERLVDCLLWRSFN